MFTQKPITPLQGRDDNKRKELLSLKKEQQTVASASANRTLTYRATRDSNTKTTCHNSTTQK